MRTLSEPRSRVGALRRLANQGLMKGDKDEIAPGLGKCDQSENDGERFAQGTSTFPALATANKASAGYWLIMCSGNSWSLE